MRKLKEFCESSKRKYVAFISVLLFLLVSMQVTRGQESVPNFRFGVFADPMISWYSSDTKFTVSDGSRAGFNFGITYNKYFAKNYSFSTGLSLFIAGGNLHNTETVEMNFNNFSTKVDSGKVVNYRTQYISIPLGLRFESNQIGYITFFTDAGFDAKVLISAKADIPSQQITRENAMDEVNPFTLSYHIMTGIEYSLGGTTAVVLGLGYENSFLDITRDRGDQPKDHITQNIIRFRIGINF